MEFYLNFKMPFMKNIFLCSKHDVPMEDHDNGQAQEFSKSKFMPRADGPFKVLEKINGNAYKIDLPGEYGLSCTFNMADLKPYYEDNLLENLRENSL